MTVLLIGKGRSIRAPNSPVQQYLLFTANQRLGLSETLSGQAEETSQFPQLLSLWKHIELLMREDAVMEGPSKSCWSLVFFPCFYHVCF